jgi:signal transduction histidine kinase
LKENKIDMASNNESAIDLAMAEKLSEYQQKVSENERNPVVSVFLSLINLGVDTVPVKAQKKYVRISNFIAANTFLGSLVYAVIGLLWEKWFLLECSLLMSIVSVGVVALNSFGKTFYSRLLLVFGVDITTYLLVLQVGPAAQANSFMVLAIIIPFLVFNIRKITPIVIGVVVPTIMLFAYTSVTPYFSSYYPAIEDQELLYKIGLGLQIYLLIISIYQFVYYIGRTEKELEISKEQMLLQTSELRRSNADLEQFAYIISHDLKAPVRNISSFMNLLVNKYGPTMNPEAKEFIGYSHSGAKRLERLIDDVLAYCRIGINLPKPTPVNLNDVINTIRFELRERLAANGGVITVNKDLPAINNVHSSLMYHVFQNLISNGLKFNKNEKPEINITWTNSLNYYTFSVADNGIGISKEYSATIFQMFKRLHTENEYDGTGIGLAICKKIAEYYHGEIWFESEAGKGTTFHFTVRKF